MADKFTYTALHPLVHVILIVAALIQSKDQSGMCEPSKVTDDWVTKGCHVHVNGVELNIYTDHLARVKFRAVFSSTPADILKAAIKSAFEDCLRNPLVRRRWMQRLDMARILMLNYQGELHPKANGRMLEFKFLKIAIERWD